MKATRTFIRLQLTAQTKQDLDVLDSLAAKLQKDGYVKEVVLKEKTERGKKGEK